MYNANDNVHLKTKFIMLILQLSLTLQNDSVFAYKMWKRKHKADRCL